MKQKLFRLALTLVVALVILTVIASPALAWVQYPTDVTAQVLVVSAPGYPLQGVRVELVNSDGTVGKTGWTGSSGTVNLFARMKPDSTVGVRVYYPGECCWNTTYISGERTCFYGGVWMFFAYFDLGEYHNLDEVSTYTYYKDCWRYPRN
ncbi:MAG TPA: hypothetical protein VMX14_06125 [Anaerolineae bacterium]|nr:hypothetical protein [Anaerolineae bacterium]